LSSIALICWQEVITRAMAESTTTSSALDHLADNVRALRETRGLSQQQIARAAGIPRATWTHLESGAANPTLAVLIKVANALQVRVDELLGSPRQPARVLRADELPSRQRGSVAIRKLLPEPLPGLDLERMTLPPGARMVGVPHTPGTREYLTCERGTVELTVAGERYVLREGDVVMFRGDQRHAYHNPGNTVAIAYSAIAFAPMAA
jgi:transcriptional regulator with XRE-family HTH domain